MNRPPVWLGPRLTMTILVWRWRWRLPLPALAKGHTAGVVTGWGDARYGGTVRICAGDLRKGGEFILYRGREAGDPFPVLMLAPVAEQPALASHRRLQHEHSHAAELDPAWACSPSPASVRLRFNEEPNQVPNVSLASETVKQVTSRLLLFCLVFLFFAINPVSALDTS